jgi:hypothetical protein
MARHGRSLLGGGRWAVSVGALIVDELAPSLLCGRRIVSGDGVLGGARARGGVGWPAHDHRSAAASASTIPNGITVAGGPSASGVGRVSCTRAGRRCPAATWSGASPDYVAPMGAVHVALYQRRAPVDCRTSTTPERTGEAIMRDGAALGGRELHEERGGTAIRGRGHRGWSLVNVCHDMASVFGASPLGDRRC